MEMSPDAGLIPAETILAVRAEEVFANTLDPASERVHAKDSSNTERDLAFDHIM
jgi:hypothetical protein